MPGLRFPHALCFDWVWVGSDRGWVYYPPVCQQTWCFCRFLVPSCLWLRFSCWSVHATCQCLDSFPWVFFLIAPPCHCFSFPLLRCGDHTQKKKNLLVLFHKFSKKWHTVGYAIQNAPIYTCYDHLIHLQASHHTQQQLSVAALWDTLSIFETWSTPSSRPPRLLGLGNLHRPATVCWFFTLGPPQACPWLFCLQLFQWMGRDRRDEVCKTQQM